MEKKYKLGIIGYGGMASQHHRELDKYKTPVQPYGVYDLDSKRLEVAKKRGLKVYDSQEALLADKDIDIVLVATTNEVHKEISIAALRAGKHVICEKPVTLTSAELLEIMDVAKETGKIFTVDQNRRTNRDFVLMRRAVEAGKIGELYHLESHVEGSRGMPSGWRTKKELGGGMMLDWGVHLIDQIMYMIDEKVVSIYCKMYHIDYKEVDDNFLLYMTFESGLTVVVGVATNNYVKRPRWYALGKDGTLIINDWDCKGKIVRCRDKASTWDEEICYTKAGPTKTMAPRKSKTVLKTKLREPRDVVNNLSVIYNRFCDAIEGAELYVKPEECLRVLKVMEAAFVSAETGEAVKTDI